MAAASLPGLLITSTLQGATRGVMVSTSAFLACHQSEGSSLGWGLNFSGLSAWRLLKLVDRGFLRVLRFPPLLLRLVVKPITLS